VLRVKRLVMAVTTQSKATGNIIYFTNQYMGLSDPITFDEANIASYVVSMLPDKNIGSLDILDACSTISERYAYVNPDRLAVELSARILNDKQEARTTTLAHILIATAGYFIYKLFIKK
jgi:hypothetical protein